MKCLLSSDIVKEKRFRIAGAAIISVFVIVVIVVCSTVLRSSDDESIPVDDNSTVIPPSFTRTLILQIDESDLWSLDIDEKNSSFIVRKWKDPISSFDYYMKKTIYIASNGIGKPIESKPIESEIYPNLSQPSYWRADKIAVDHVNGKLYVSDVSASNINIFDVMADHYNIVWSHVRGLKDIALDSTKRLIFILQTSSVIYFISPSDYRVIGWHYYLFQIISAKIDGTSPEIIVNNSAITSFTIDHEGKIYYADLENINSVNYTGNEHHVVTRISHEVTSIAAIENNIFWLDRSFNTDNSILYSCKTTNGKCESVSEISFSGKLIQMKAYNFKDVQTSNPCKGQSRGCHHMCIMISVNSSRCVCSIGWQLDTDSKACKPADDFLLYVEDNYVKTQFVKESSESFTEAMLPQKLNISFSAECHFDFDVRKRMLFFSDGRDMYQTKLNTHSEQIKMTLDKSSEMTIPVIDWTSNNLYYTTFGGSTVKIWYVKVHSVQSSENFDNDKIILSVYGDWNITSLVVHPKRGVLFCTAIETFGTFPDTRIYKVPLDGGSYSKYRPDVSFSTDKNVLALDYEDDRIYWFHKDKHEIKFSQLDVNETNSIDILFIENPTTMSIYKNWLYVATSTSVWRLDKISGRNAVEIFPKYQQGTSRIYGAKIFSRDVQPIDNSHPCVIDNGNCQRYCFGVPSQARTLRKVCGCLENEKLNADGHTCHLRV